MSFHPEKAWFFAVSPRRTCFQGGQTCATPAPGPDSKRAQEVTLNAVPVTAVSRCSWARATRSVAACASSPRNSSAVAMSRTDSVRYTDWITRRRKNGRCRRCFKTAIRMMVNRLAVVRGRYHLKIGVGYNFTDFSDDLTDLDYQNNGWFVNFVGKL
jgi:hypothetical protein